MDSLLDDFDDLELNSSIQYQADNKGKASLYDDESSSDEEDDQAPGSSSKKPDSEPGDMTCAVCLNDIPLLDLAMIKGCGHIYCAKCILAWALHKENPCCPQCKQPFNYLLTYRTLDGDLQDFPTEESVVLLKRATWVQDDLKSVLEDASLIEASQAADDIAWHEYADEYDLAEDDAIEDFYYSSAAGRARVIMGNRRFGEGGYIATGRRCARPSRRAGGGKAGKAKTAAAAATSKGNNNHGASTSRSIDIATPNAHGGRKSNALATPSPSFNNGSLPRDGSYILGESPGAGSSAGLYGSSPAGSGRRAKRNARRAAFDSTAASGGASSSSPSASGVVDSTVAVAAV